MKVKLKTKYIEAEAELRVAKYPNGRKAIYFVDAETKEELLIATTNLPNHRLPPGHVFIKDYSENEGILSEMIRLGLCKPSAKTAASGFVEIPMVELTLPEEYK